MADSIISRQEEEERLRAFSRTTLALEDNAADSDAIWD